jgi:2,5-diketo-D-gluconate reductase A
MEANEAVAQSVDIGSGVRMPLLGLGARLAVGRDAYQAVRRALDIVYRHIDTATMHGNEEQIGRAVADSGLPREAVFITTQLPPGNAGRERATIEASLRALSTEYVDLWLIHWPASGRARPDVWERFLEIQRAGLARAVGVSNYSLAQIDELERATGPLPAVNQIEWSPVLFDEQILLGHRQRGVQLEDYGPLKTTNLRHPLLVRIAQAHGVSPAPGRDSLAHRAPRRGHPQIDQPRPHRRECRRLRLHPVGSRNRRARQPVSVFQVGRNLRQTEAPGGTPSGYPTPDTQFRRVVVKELAAVPDAITCRVTFGLAFSFSPGCRDGWLHDCCRGRFSVAQRNRWLDSTR